MAISTAEHPSMVEMRPITHQYSLMPALFGLFTNYLIKSYRNSALAPVTAGA